MKLARRYKRREHFDDNWKEQSEGLYKFMRGALRFLLYPKGEPTPESDVRPQNPDLCLRLFISCGQVADQCGFPNQADDFFVHAFTAYEEGIDDSRSQFPAVCLLIGALQQTRSLTREDYDKLITKAALHGSRLLKKPDQCRAVYLASHLWWAVETPNGEGESKDVSIACFSCLTRPCSLLRAQLYRDGKRVLECLQRALRVADACMDTAVSVELFVEILNRYVYYFDQQNESVCQPRRH